LELVFPDIANCQPQLGDLRLYCLYAGRLAIHGEGPFHAILACDCFISEHCHCIANSWHCPISIHCQFNSIIQLPHCQFNSIPGIRRVALAEWCAQHCEPGTTPASTFLLFLLFLLYFPSI
jgi:hypothetical protein